MEISLTAVSGNRRFTKLMVRLSAAIDELRQAGLHVDTTGLAFDILQVVFMDDVQGSPKVIGCKKDRLFQVHVTIPSDAVAVGSDERALVRMVADCLSAAVKVAQLPSVVESDLQEAIARVKNSGQETVSG
jgi:hypothetical protein